MGDELAAEDRCGLTALFWSNINPYATFRLAMEKRLDLGDAVNLPRPTRSKTATSEPS